MARKYRFLVALGVECTLSDGSACGTISTIYAHVPASTSKDRSDCIYTRRKRPAKQPCFDSEGEPHSAVERGGGGGRGVSYPGPSGKRGAPRSLRKNLFDNFSILTANVNPFHVSC